MGFNTSVPPKVMYLLDSPKLQYTCALVLRILCIIWAHVADLNSGLKYTDIDYYVFTDAAKYITEGDSPYERPTYRYTPLLAWMLTPNILWDMNFGKLLFSILDIVNGCIIYSLVNQKYGKEKAAQSLFVWLFNPIIWVISTRGSAETVIMFFVFLSLYWHHRSHYFLSGIFLGFSVHVKIYPIIYSLVMYLSISKVSSFLNGLKPNWDKTRFVFGFILSLSTLTCIGLYLYGWSFIENSYLYHVRRQDLRHNFSLYFYLLYLQSNQENLFIAVVTFLPQLLTSLTISWRCRRKSSLNLACFLLTFAFVSFNKVVTSQYFVWYIGLLPLCMAELKWNWKKIALLVLWFVGQGVWLLFGYQLEFLGENVFLLLWMASVFFFCVNVYIIGDCMHDICMKSKSS